MAMDEAALRQLQEMFTQLAETGTSTNASLDLAGKQAETAARHHAALALAGQQATTGLGGFAKALVSTTPGMSKYGASLSSMASTATGVTGALSGFLSMLGPVGKIAGLVVSSLGGIAKVAALFTSAVLDQNDALLKSYDNLGQFGTANKLTTDSLMKLAHSAGYSTHNIDAFTSNIKRLGSDLIALGGTTAAGVVNFSKLLSVSQRMRDSFNRLGINQDELGKRQGDFIKATTGAGISLAKSPELLQKQSLKYVEVLNELAALTGMERDEVQAAIEAANNNINVQTHQYEMNKKEVQARKDALEAEKSGNEVLKRQKLAEAKMYYDIQENTRKASVAISAFADSNQQAGMLSMMTSDAWSKSSETLAMTFPGIRELGVRLRKGEDISIELMDMQANATREMLDKFGGIFKIGTAGQELATSVGVSAKNIKMMADWNSLDKNKRLELLATMQKEMEAKKKGLGEPDPRKEEQNKMLKAEIDARQALDEFVDGMRGPVMSAFNGLIDAMYALGRFIGVITKNKDLEDRFTTEEDLKKERVKLLERRKEIEENNPTAKLKEKMAMNPKERGEALNKDLVVANEAKQKADETYQEFLKNPANRKEANFKETEKKLREDRDKKTLAANEAQQLKKNENKLGAILKEREDRLAKIDTDLDENTRGLNKKGLDSRHIKTEDSTTKEVRQLKKDITLAEKEAAEREKRLINQSYADLRIQGVSDEESFKRWREDETVANRMTDAAKESKKQEEGFKKLIKDNNREVDILKSKLADLEKKNTEIQLAEAHERNKELTKPKSSDSYREEGAKHQYKSLADIVAGGESGKDNYNATNNGSAGGKTDKHDLTKMTIGEVQALQKDKKIFAAGRYQVIPSTLKAAIEKLGLKESDKFDEQTQDRIFNEFLIGSKRPEVQSLLKNEKGASFTKAILGMAKEFASIGVPEDTKRPAGKNWPEADIKKGQSYYEGVAGNRAHIPPDVVQAALAQEFAQLNPGAELPKAKTGGVFSGPDSGFPVELHGNEVVSPYDPTSLLATLMMEPSAIGVRKLRELVFPKEFRSVEVDKPIASETDPTKLLASLLQSKLREIAFPKEKTEKIDLPSVIERIEKKKEVKPEPVAPAPQPVQPIQQNVDKTQELFGDMISTLNAKFDNMIDKLSTSNSLQEQLLQYSRN